MIHREQGKKWDLPDVLRIGNTADHRHDGVMCEYRVEVRCPKAGEYYLSGSCVEAYQAFFDLDYPFLVVVERWPVRKVTKWERIL